jgi:hypothetical protein
MNTSNFPARLLALAIALVILGGCKIVDDSVDTSTGQDASATGAAPIIWGDPDTSVVVDTNYVFQPESSDSDGDILEFTIANKPSWANFDTSSGVLQGIPGSQHIGQHGNIVISVTDQTSVVSLPSFDITVATAVIPEEEDGDASSPPIISGTPNTSIAVDTAYSFTPAASDPDGDTLSFSIVNKPVWTTFNTTSGRLQGTPTSSHIGTGDPIDISVTDGSSIAALSRFSITVEAVGALSHTITWTPPTVNEDGSALTNLAGYRIYYGTTSGDYQELIDLNSGGMTSHVITGLTPGTYFLAMSSINASGVESDLTPEISFELGT